MHAKHACMCVPAPSFPGGLHDIQIRVGNTLPTQGLAGDQALTTNALCGTYAGPSAAGDIVRVNCSAPLAGRYVSLQASW